MCGGGVEESDGLEVVLCHPLFVAVLLGIWVAGDDGCKGVAKATLVEWKFGCGCWCGWEAEPGARGCA